MRLKDAEEMYEVLKRTIFLSIPFITSLCLSLIITYLYYKDGNKRKLLFAIGLFLSSFGFYNLMLESIGSTPRLPSANWLLIPITFAVSIAALSSLFKIKNFEKPLAIFLIGTGLSIIAFLTQFSFESLRLALMVTFMGIAIPILTYLFMKSRDSLNLKFLLATLCFLFQGVTMELGSSEDIPVMLALFGIVFIGLMFTAPNGGGVVSMASFVILEKKLDAANENLKNAQEKLLKAERLATIGELAGMIGHDLRNPLQGIAASTYYLKTKTNATIDGAGREMLENIEVCIARSNKIINDLIEYAQTIHLELAETNPKSMVDNALNQIEVPSNIEIVNTNSTYPVLNLDTGRIERVFVSIIKNALDAMPSGGRLTLKSEQTKGNAVFRFEDAGTGMSQETLSKLWTPLFTTKAKGMGFGLAICKRFIEAHGGTITAQSTLGKGSLFTVTFPLKPKTVEPAPSNKST